MKRLFLIIIAVFALNSMTANPVDVNKAKALGQKFSGVDVELAYTALSDRNEACYYVFNTDTGFVIISADDFYRPIIGYSDNGKFDVGNVPPALQDYLDGIVEARSIDRASRNAAAPDVAADWNMLEKTGRLVSRHGGRGTGYFVKTKWNQDWPYNCFCPDDPAGSGGHAIVGCLATSMSQLMRFWSHPIEGQGSHCYYHFVYGEICADFNTVYDWENMPEILSANAPVEQRLAVGTLCFHCGVSIDMWYGPDGSGGGSGGIPEVMNTYFDYCDAIVQRERNQYDAKTWKSMVREQFDMGWPMYYGGCEDDGCHAFICDGYNDYDMFHFNLGWGGSSDGWYLIDDAPYTHPADAMFNFVPNYVYEATPSAPTNLVVTPGSDTSFEATLSWTNPTTYLGGVQLTDIEKVVVMRNCQIISEITEGVTPGAAMTFTDHVPYYDCYEYKVYVVSGGRNGKQVIERDATIGPTCDWQITLETTDIYGWQGNNISLYNMANTEIANFTMPSSTTVTRHIDMPVGPIKFVWHSLNGIVDDISITIRNSQNEVVYQYSGSTENLSDGVIYATNNGCGNTGTCDAPTDLIGVADGDDVLLEWNGSLNNAYTYCIYRDEVIYRMVTDNSTPFTDDDTGNSGHCYNVSILCQNGESEWSNISCVVVGDACDPATNLWYRTQANGKPILTWDTPEHNGRLTGYYLYRKQNDDEYKRVKNIGPTKREYKETMLLTPGNWYTYKLVAYYSHNDCYSIPAKSLYGNEFFVKVYYDPEHLGIDENLTQNIEIYPNPAKDMLTVKANSITNVMIYNSLGQKVYEKSADSSEVPINLDGFDTGIYLVKVVADGEVVTRKVSVVK